MAVVTCFASSNKINNFIFIIVTIIFDKIKAFFNNVFKIMIRYD